MSKSITSNTPKSMKSAPPTAAASAASPAVSRDESDESIDPDELPNCRCSSICRRRTFWYILNFLIILTIVGGGIILTSPVFNTDGSNYSLNECYVRLAIFLILYLPCLAVRREWHSTLRNKFNIDIPRNLFIDYEIPVLSKLLVLFFSTTDGGSGGKLGINNSNNNNNNNNTVKKITTINKPINAAASNNNNNNSSNNKTNSIVPIEVTIIESTTTASINNNNSHSDSIDMALICNIILAGTYSGTAIYYHLFSNDWSVWGIQTLTLCVLGALFNISNTISKINPIIAETYHYTKIVLYYSTIYLLRNCIRLCSALESGIRKIKIKRRIINQNNQANTDNNNNNNTSIVPVVTRSTIVIQPPPRKQSIEIVTDNNNNSKDTAINTPKTPAKSSASVSAAINTSNKDNNKDTVTSITTNNTDKTNRTKSINSPNSNSTATVTVTAAAAAAAAIDPIKRNSIVNNSTSNTATAPAKRTGSVIEINPDSIPEIAIAINNDNNNSTNKTKLLSPTKKNSITEKV